MRLVLATRNAHKAREFATLLAPHEIVALPEDVELPPETGETFFENAREKALAAARATGMTAIADDSGIEAAALGGAPGVRSARFAGEHATDEENLAKLLRDAPAGSPLAYVCALVLAEPREGEAVAAGEGRCRGRRGRRRGRRCRGRSGWRRDRARRRRALHRHARRQARAATAGSATTPRSCPTTSATGARWPSSPRHEKDAISHRGRAARALLARLAG